MKDAPPPLLNRVFRKLRSIPMRREMRAYLANMSADNPLRGIPARVVGDASADPAEFFTHYDAYAYWVAKNLAKIGCHRRILDVGSPKMQTAMLSATNDVTSLVLADCSDRFSQVTYVLHDIADPLPFPDASFSCLTSTVALPLVGLGRYGDRVDPNCLPQFISELDRVMTTDAELIISMCLGPNFLAFNNGWYLDITIIKKLFKDWLLVDKLVDTWSSPSGITLGTVDKRFISDTTTENISLGNYQVVFLHFKRNK